MVATGTDAAAGLFVVGLAFVLVAAVTWNPLWLCPGCALVVASALATTWRRRTGPVPGARTPGRRRRF